MSNKCNICGRDYELGGRTIKGLNFCSRSCRKIFDGRVVIIYQEEHARMVERVKERVKKECTV